MASGVFAQPATPTSDWSLETIVLKSGATFRGLILEDSPQEVKFRIVERKPGRLTTTLTIAFAKSQTVELKPLPDAERQMLKKRLSDLDAQENRERKRRDGIELKPVTWLEKKDSARSYETDQFVLVSSAPDEVTRRACVRLEQIYLAFAWVLPPRQAAVRATKIELAGSQSEYETVLKRARIPVLNAAVFVVEEQRIVCGSDLKRWGEELHRATIHHSQQLATATKTEQQLRELYKGPGYKAELERHLAALKKERDKLYAAERENEKAFDEATRKLFATLYHEAFHSYVLTYVYRPMPAAEIQAGKGTGELPRWLNEGLAQLFEDPVLEAGELRINHADPARLKRVQECLSGKARRTDVTALIPLSDLLRTGRAQFVTGHVNQKDATDRTYLTAWAAAYYLLFERRVVGTKELDDYLIAVNTGTDSVKAFETLVGQDLATFEKDWHEYLKKLQPDGSVKK
jgi:hypothetical protein